MFGYYHPQMGYYQSVDMGSGNMPYDEIEDELDNDPAFRDFYNPRALDRFLPREDDEDRSPDPDEDVWGRHDAFRDFYNPRALERLLPNDWWDDE